MPNDAQVQRYLKVKALAERGSPGEMNAAKTILEKMQKDIPGIAAAADAWQKKNGQSTEPEPEPTPEPDAYSESTPWEREEESSRWKDIFNFARAAMNNAYDFASHVANAYVGRNLAEQNVVSNTKATKAGNILITLKMPIPVYTYAMQSLNDVQRQAFRQVLHEILEEELDELLGTEPEEQD